ncbi:hypothetical protein [Microbulbifer sp. TRSA005]|uniref:hypothetical protein n=1 Tax=unclassified Microbulbifer TaxID=2619833 RepID=UPI00403A4C1C
MKVYLHIGSDKTGSTAIQSALSRYRTLLKSKGIIYPELVQNQDHHESLVLELQSGVKGNSWQKLEEIIATNPPHILLSSEAFCALKTIEIKRLKNWLNQPTIKVIAYLRRADEYLESGMLQRLKSTSSLKAFKRQYLIAKHVPTILDPYVFNAAFKAFFLVKWQRVYPEQVIIRPYDKNQWVEQNIVHDLLNRLGLNKNLDDLKPASIHRNVTLDITAIYAISILSRNKLYGLRNTFSETLARGSKHKKSGPLLSWSKRTTARAMSSLFNSLALRSNNITFPSHKTEKSHGLPKLSKLINTAENIVAGYLAETNRIKNKLQGQLNETSRSSHK